jgi:hypothetical protein
VDDNEAEKKREGLKLISRNILKILTNGLHSCNSKVVGSNPIGATCFMFSLLNTPKDS